MAFKGKDVTPEKRTDFTYKGREIILSKTRGRPFGGIQKKPGWYPEEKRIEAASIYAVTGSSKRTGELVGVPEATVKGWVRTEWFQKLLDDIRAENDHVIDAKFNQILDKSLELVMDRLEFGDFHVLRDGSLVRKPVGLRDLTISQAITIDKRQLLRGKATTRTEQINPQRQIEDKLQVLADAFTKLAGKEPKKVETIDAEVIEYHVERPDDSGTGEDNRGDGGGSDDLHTAEGNPEEQAGQAAD